MINWGAIDAASTDALVGVANRWGARVSRAAKQRAPVRKIFHGQGEQERIRLKTMDEIQQDRGLRRRLGLGPEYGPLNPAGAAPATVLTRYAPQEMGQRDIGKPHVRLKLPTAQRRLDYRGMWELRSMRAAHGGKLGGRLRDEIYSTKAVARGDKITVEVVSPTPYAKFQELGTRHNPAHPYLRPSAYESVDGVQMDLKSTMPAVVTPHLHATIPVVIRI